MEDVDGNKRIATSYLLNQLRINGGGGGHFVRGESITIALFCTPKTN